MSRQEDESLHPQGKVGGDAANDKLNGKKHDDNPVQGLGNNAVMFRTIAQHQHWTYCISECLNFVLILSGIDNA
jgi:hypothetical protein